MSNNEKMVRIFIVLVVLGVALIFYSKRDSFKSSNQSIVENQQDELQSESKPKNELQNERMRKRQQRQRYQQRLNEELEKIKKDMVAHEKALDEDPSSTSQTEAQSEEVKKKFRDVAKVKMDLPKDILFTSINMADDTNAIYGYDQIDNLGLTVMAHPKIIKNEQVFSYLDLNQKFLPEIEKNPVKIIKKPLSLPEPKANTNLKKGTLWSGLLQDGKELHIIKVERADKQGTYFFVYTGPKKYFSENNDFFQRLYESTIALSNN